MRSAGGIGLEFLQAIEGHNDAILPTRIILPEPLASIHLVAKTNAFDFWAFIAKGDNLVSPEFLLFWSGTEKKLNKNDVCDHIEPLASNFVRVRSLLNWTAASEQSPFRPRIGPNG